MEAAQVVKALPGESSNEEGKRKARNLEMGRLSLLERVGFIGKCPRNTVRRKYGDIPKRPKCGGCLVSARLAR